MVLMQAVNAKNSWLSIRMNAKGTGLDKNVVHRILSDHL